MPGHPDLVIPCEMTCRMCQGKRGFPIAGRNAGISSRGSVFSRSLVFPVLILLT